MRMLLNKSESMSELNLQLNCKFTDNEKENCVPTIHRIVELVNLARMNGILALEQEMEHEPNVFLKTGILLVVDGTDPAIVKQILQNMIVAEKYSGSQLLDRLLLAEGIMAINFGETNSEIIALTLISMLGEKYISRLKEEIITQSPQSEKIKKYSDFLKTLKNKIALPKSMLFEAKFMQLDSNSTQLVIHSVNTYDLILALHGCGIILIHKVFNNVSLNTCLQICEDWKLFKYSDDDSIFLAQERIIKLIETLEDSGAVYLIDEK